MDCQKALIEARKLDANATPQLCRQCSQLDLCQVQRAVPVAVPTVAVPTVAVPTVPTVAVPVVQNTLRKQFKVSLWKECQKLRRPGRGIFLEHEMHEVQKPRRRIEVMDRCPRDGETQAIFWMSCSCGYAWANISLLEKMYNNESVRCKECGHSAKAEDLVDEFFCQKGRRAIEKLERKQPSFDRTGWGGDWEDENHNRNRPIIGAVTLREIIENEVFEVQEGLTIRLEKLVEKTSRTAKQEAVLKEAKRRLAEALVTGQGVNTAQRWAVKVDKEFCMVEREWVTMPNPGWDGDVVEQKLMEASFRNYGMKPKMGAISVHEYGRSVIIDLKWEKDGTMWRIHATGSLAWWKKMYEARKEEIDSRYERELQRAWSACNRVLANLKMARMEEEREREDSCGWQKAMEEEQAASCGLAI